MFQTTQAAGVRASHPLILDEEKPCAVFEFDLERQNLRLELEHLFPRDEQVRELLLPILCGEELTERKRLQIEACFKFPYVVDLQEAYVKRALGEELSAFEEKLLWRMDGAANSDFSIKD